MMDDGHASRLQARPQSLGYDIGPDEDRNCTLNQNDWMSAHHSVFADDTEGDQAQMGHHNTMFTEYLDETPSNLTDITDMYATDSNSQGDELYHEVNRRKTFEGCWDTNYYVDPNDLARNGFVYHGPRDKVKCVFCLKTLWNWEPGDSVEEEHRKHYPNCPFVRGNCGHLNVPVNSFEKSMGLQVKASEENVPALDNFFGRLESFKNWPVKNVTASHTLAEAGFYYIGEDDKVQCYSCQLQLPSWRPGDDPWYLHARSSPSCAHLKSMKGAEFVDQVHKRQMSHGQQRGAVAGSEPVAAASEKNALPACSSADTRPKSNCPSLDSQIERDMQSLVVTAWTTTLGISEDRIQQKLIQIRKSRGPDYQVTSKDFEDLLD